MRIIHHFLTFFPSILQFEIENRLNGKMWKLEEVRMRLGRPSSLTVSGDNLILPHRATERELAETLSRFAGGSVYAHEEQIREGYLPLAGGARLGVVGQATDLCLRGIRGVTSLVLRIPHMAQGVAREVYAIWRKSPMGLLIYAPPGGGKTTFLKDFIRLASTGENAMRVAVVDTRGELCVGCVGDMVDVLEGYPRKEGMEIALRTMNPQVIVCDEIGERDDSAIRTVSHSGVPLVASCHGRSEEEVLCRPAIGAWVGGGVFPMRHGVRRDW